MKLVMLLIALFPTVIAAQQRSQDTSSVADLPLKEMPAGKPCTTLALFMTGDGGWASLDRHVVADLTAHGISVIGMNSREYLTHAKTPDQVGRDVARIVRRYMNEWNCESLIISGYSRGADLAPFAVSRMPADLRQKLLLVAMVGLSEYAGFEFHLIDIIAAPHRKSDQPTLAEIAKLSGVKMLCVYGKDEEDSGCRGAPPGAMQQVVLPGGHHFNDEFDQLGDLIIAAARPPAP